MSRETAPKSHVIHLVVSPLIYDQLIKKHREMNRDGGSVSLSHTVRAVLIAGLGRPRTTEQK
jgi:hypothetical protein